MTAPYGLMADLHLHPWSAFSRTTPDGQNSRLQALLGEIERCASEVNAAGGNVVVMAGDIFHVRGSVAPSVLNATRDMLNDIGDTHNVAFHIMPGNHDLEGKHSTRLSSAVTALESIFVKVISQPHYSGKDMRVVMVPWFESVDDLKATIDKLGTGDMPKFLRENTDLILHAPIDGVITGIPAHGLTAEYLAGLGYHRVFAGHYHNHKRFDGDVYSIGALAHHSWCDIGSKAGYLLVYPDRVDWRKSHLPEFVDLSQLTDVDPDEIHLLVDKNFVRVKVEASKVKEVEAARQELLDMGAAAVIVQAEPKPPARDGAGTAPTKAAGASLEVSVADFIKKMCAETGQIEQVQKAAMDVLASIDSSGE
jgi:DNA repair exonuclease SbcCD nuclease subunit